MIDVILGMLRVLTFTRSLTFPSFRSAMQFIVLYDSWSVADFRLRMKMFKPKTPVANLATYKRVEGVITNKGCG